MRWLIFIPFLIALGASIQHLNAQETTPALDTLEDEKAIFASAELQRFAKLFEQIRQLYVDEISDAELLDMAVRGLLGELDPHSEYLSDERQNVLEQGAKGTFTGIGVELSMEEGEFTIVAPLDKSPAAAAGLQPGDVILSIQGRSTWGMTLNEALDAMVGPEGSELKLMISRHLDEPFEISLIRSQIALDSVTVSTLAHDVGYIRIRQFQSDTGAELSEQISNLLAEHPYLIGLVLDLRNNPGGVLQAAVEVTDAFINDGLIVTTIGRDPSANSAFYASTNSISTELPLVIIINRGSASASEIVAGALQDHGRALILGDISFGKGSVQNLIQLDGERSIKLTTARYFTPSGRSIQAQGIYPDITVLPGEISFSNSDEFVSEADLSDHLGSDNSTQSPELLGFRQTLGDITDIQLSQAVLLLKGMAVY